MKPSNRIITLGLCIILALAANAFAADEVTITGTLYASAWDDNDDPTEVVIMNEAGDFVVDDNAIGQQLLELAGKDVQVKGVVKEDNQGRRTITVVNFTLITD